MDMKLHGPLCRRRRTSSPCGSKRTHPVDSFRVQSQGRERETRPCENSRSELLCPSRVRSLPKDTHTFTGFEFSHSRVSDFPSLRLRYTHTHEMVDSSVECSRNRVLKISLQAAQCTQGICFPAPSRRISQALHPPASRPLTAGLWLTLR